MDAVGRRGARLWKRAITREGQSRVDLDARAADCYDIIVRRGGGAGLGVDEADGTAPESRLCDSRC